MSTCIRQSAASHPKFTSTPTFTFCSPTCPNTCGVVLFVKTYSSFREITIFVRPLKYANMLFRKVNLIDKLPTDLGY